VEIICTVCYNVKKLWIPLTDCISVFTYCYNWSRLFPSTLLIVGFYRADGTYILWVRNWSLLPSSAEPQTSKAVPFSTVSRFLSRACSCGVCGGKIALGLVLLRVGISRFLFLYHSTDVPYSFSSSKLLLTGQRAKLENLPINVTLFRKFGASGKKSSSIVHPSEG